MRTNYMRYETGAEKVLRPLSVRRSSVISKMSSGQIVWHLYKRHELLLLQVTVAVVFVWAIVTKLG
jgi:hypothetical protein